MSKTRVISQDIGDASVLPADLDVSADNTTADATTGHHGLLQKLGGGSTNFLRADGTWAAPSGSGAPASVDYLVGTADGGLSSEIVVGTTPGGELGGTWASPTVDSSHAGGTHAAATAAAIGPYAIVRYTIGDIALTSTSMVALSGPGDCVVAAAAGDLLLVGLSARAVANDADSISLDVATIVSAAAVNFISSLNGTPLLTGISGWFITGDASAAPHGGGSMVYVVQAGDISGGNVTLRLYYRVSGNRSISGSATVPLVFWVKNLKQ